IRSDMLKRAGVLLSAAILFELAGPAPPVAQGVPEDLPPTAEAAYGAVAARFDEQDALSVVSFMDRYWRLAGNPGFNASIDHICDRLVAPGFVPTPGTAPGSVCACLVPK